ncbi:MAG TPA: efflux RND transporter periplasmic adaptor subunit [Thermoanaerobaculaceae bacterium]|nr:efflux RND transporter periplasmic adaptor subunit [Thermoanaerobaculaceae bacterium]
MRRRRVWLIIGGLAVVLIGGGYYLSYQKKHAPTEVSVAKVALEDVVAKVTANGKIQAEKKVDLAALVMGQIVNLAVREGDPVKTGDFLLQIDKTHAAAEEAGSAAALSASQSQLDSARAALEQAQGDFTRAQDNYNSGIIAAADFQHAQAALDTARAAYQTAVHQIEQSRAVLNASRDDLSKTTVRSPIDGIITTLRIKAGEVTVVGTMNNPGTQLMTISDMSTVQAVLMVDETDTPSIALGQKAVLTMDSYPDRRFDGVVTEIGSSPIAKDDVELVGLITTSDAINFKVRVKLLDPPPSIRPGFSVTADIITGTRSKVLAIPLAAVVIRDSPKGDRDATGRLKTEQGVYTVESGKVRFLQVKTGLTGELKVEVTDGLKPGVEVVTGPFKTLRTIKEGDRIKPMSEERRKAVEAAQEGGSV